MALGFGKGPVSLVWVCGEQNGPHTWDPIENRSGSENPSPWKMPRSPGLFLIKPTVESSISSASNCSSTLSKFLRNSAENLSEQWVSLKKGNRETVHGNVVAQSDGGSWVFSGGSSSWSRDGRGDWEGAEEH